MLFSKRMNLAKRAEEWCKSKNADDHSLGIVTALSVMGFLLEDPKEPLKSFTVNELLDEIKSRINCDCGREKNCVCPVCDNDDIDIP